MKRSVSVGDRVIVTAKDDSDYKSVGEIVEILPNGWVHVRVQVSYRADNYPRTMLASSVSVIRKVVS